MSVKALLTRRRPAAPETDTPLGAHLTRPRLAAGVEVHEPLTEGEPWVLQVGEHRYFRIGADLATLTRRLDGDADVDQLAAGLGPAWTPDTVRSALESLDRANLVARAQDAPPRRPGRVKYVPPLTLQFTVVRNSSGAARRLHRLLVVTPRTLAATVGVLVVVGAIGLVVRQAQVAAVMSSPVSMRMVLIVLAAVSVTTVLHELGHAVLLHHYGGRPGRLGIMLFYLSPAMFCDVSDAWRLTNRQRARVALAGVFVQLAMSGASATAALLAGDGAAGDVFVLFSLVNAAAAVINLVPFVKLDGYIALMSHLDMPNLRQNALASVRTRLVALLAGERTGRDGPRWLPWFGVASLLTPVVLIVRVLGQWLEPLLTLGYFGTTLAASVAGFLLFVLGKAVLGFVGALRETPPRPVRLCAALLLAALAVTGVCRIEVTSGHVASYEVTADGRAVLHVPTGPDTPPVRPGDRVELTEAGMILRRTLGTATVVDLARADTLVPLTGLVPVHADDVTIPGSNYTLELDRPVRVQQGSVRLHSRSVALPRWAYERFLRPFAAPFL